MAERVRHPASAPAAAPFPHIHDVGELVLLRQAGGAFFTEGKAQAVESGSVVYVPPMRLHDFQLTTGAKEWVLVQMDPFTAERLWEPLAPALAASIWIRPDKEDAERLWRLAVWLSELTPGDSHVSPLLRLIAAEHRRHAPAPGDAVESCSPPPVERLARRCNGCGAIPHEPSARRRGRYRGRRPGRPLQANRAQLARRLFALMIVATADYVAWRALRGG